MSLIRKVRKGVQRAGTQFVAIALLYSGIQNALAQSLPPAPPQAPPAELRAHEAPPTASASSGLTPPAFDPRAEFGSIHEINTKITTTESYRPDDDSAPVLEASGSFVEPPRALDPLYVPTPYGWIDRFCYQPLYFEQRGMERFGESRGCLADSLCSIGQFYATIPTLPYRMATYSPHGIECPCCGSSSNCLPLRTPDQLDRAGVAVEAATIAGLILLIP